MIIANDIEIPDNCGCCPKREFFTQSSLCVRCPIFNCAPSFLGKDDPYADEQGNFRLLEPENYRRDWALEFKKYFDSGFSAYPKL